MNFKSFAQAVNKQFISMTNNEVFFVNVEKDELYDLYLASFPEGTNPIYKTKTEHDCSCCKQFIRNTGHVVTINDDNTLSTIWDIKVGEPAFQVVADALDSHVRTKAVAGIFRSEFRKIGAEVTHQDTEHGRIDWNHFYIDLAAKLTLSKGNSVGEFNGKVNANKEVLERGLKEITLSACEEIKDLVAQNSLYRGAEHSATITLAVKLLREFGQVKPEDQNTWLWKKSAELKEAGRFKNTVIGTLMEDLSSGVDLDAAVKKFEVKVAPANYKRPTALITQGMITKAKEKIQELGLEAALSRRYAVTEDLTINNVLFADRTARKLMTSVFDELVVKTKDKTPNLDKVQEMSIEDFIKNVLPTANTIELMLDNKHSSNLMSLIAPVDKAAGNILKWDNNFSWTYNGEVADSIKERVKAAGGKVEGDLCCRLAWDYTDDLDFHMQEPDGHEINFTNRRCLSACGGTLDVDANGGDGIMPNPVENIVYESKQRMKEGIYTLIVHNFNRRSDGVGFTVQVEMEGKLLTIEYPKVVRNREHIGVIKIKYSKVEGFSVVESMPSTATTKEVWGISTNKWAKVDMVLNSPNHWDGQDTGNKHYFFILEGCKNPESARGFYNEFLRNELTEHRKVFEVLASQLKAEYNDNQLSGVGFSSTVSNSVLCKVGGTFNRVIKINF